jgi:hypothetical protein
MTAAKVRLAMAAMGQKETKVTDLPIRAESEGVENARLVTK